MLHSILEKRILITIAIFVGIAGLIIGAIIMPTVLQIRELDKDTYQLRVTLERKNEQATGYRLAVKQLDRLRKEMPPFNDYLFNNGDELRLITTLESLATRTGVSQRITNSSLDNITNQRIQVSISVSGSYHKALTYLDELEHLPYFINVTHVSLTPFYDKKDPTITDGVIMNVDFNLYVIP
ncbi:MAG: type 4a pilus biogenesis protein PilO [Patescibacteria group bacterium]|jgi:Tfp pilus assembly protein PilO